MVVILNSFSALSKRKIIVWLDREERLSQTTISLLISLNEYQKALSYLYWLLKYLFINYSRIIYT